MESASSLISLFFFSWQKKKSS